MAEKPRLQSIAAGSEGGIWKQPVTCAVKGRGKWMYMCFPVLIPLSLFNTVQDSTPGMGATYNDLSTSIKKKKSRQSVPLQTCPRANLI